MLLDCYCAALTKGDHCPLLCIDVGFINVTFQTSISIEPGVEVEVTIADA